MHFKVGTEKFFTQQLTAPPELIRSCNLPPAGMTLAYLLSPFPKVKQRVSHRLTVLLLIDAQLTNIDGISKMASKGVTFSQIDHGNNNDILPFVSPLMYAATGIGAPVCLSVCSSACLPACPSVRPPARLPLLPPPSPPRLAPPLPACMRPSVPAFCFISCLSRHSIPARTYAGLWLLNKHDAAGANVGKQVAPSPPQPSPSCSFSPLTLACSLSALGCPVFLSRARSTRHCAYSTPLTPAPPGVLPPSMTHAITSRPPCCSRARDTRSSTQTNACLTPSLVSASDGKLTARHIAILRRHRRHRRV